MRKFLSPIACAAALALCACAQQQKDLSGIATFTAADAENASAMATKAGGDALQRKPCYDGWAALAGGVGSAAGAQIGVFTGTEAALEAESLINTPACAGIAAQAIVNGIRIANAVVAAPVAAAGAAAILSPVKPIP